MTYGLQVFAADNQLTYDSSMVTWNQVSTLVVPANSAGFGAHTISPDKEMLAMAFFVDAPAIDRESLMPTVSISPNGLYVGGDSTPAEKVVVLGLMR